MRILLIQPPFTILKAESKKCHPPLGLAYLTAVLKGKYEVIILDALAEGFEHQEDIDNAFLRYGLPFKEIKDRISRIKPDIVGVSCPFSTQSQNVHNICRLIKETDRDIVTILGGAHPSALPHKVLEDKNVDFVIIGEGEIALLELLGEIEEGNKASNVSAVAYKEDGRIKINPRVGFIDNLDNLPFPDWSIFPLEKYFTIGRPHGSLTQRAPFIPVITSRGCPFKCIFCSIHNIWGRQYRKRSVESVLSELDYLIKDFGIREVLFEDDNLTLDKCRAKQLFEDMINRRLDITWTTPNGIFVQTLDDEMLSLMKNSGCYSISIGVESGDKDILKKLIGKPIELSRVKPIINKAKSLHMETTVFFVVGLPGETKKQLKATFKFAEKIEADNTNFFFATPLPGTKLLELCKNKGFIGEELDYTRLSSTEPAFSSGELSISELKSMVNRERLILYIRLLFRNPGMFFNKIFIKLSRDLGYFIRFKRKVL